MTRRIFTLLACLVATITALQAQAQTPPDNEIWYTTTDGKKISFNANNLVSNSYNNGRGVLKFKSGGYINFINSGLFGGENRLKSITIPNSVTSIGELAFSYCNSLTSITIPNSVTSIGNGAFIGCSSLTSITIPNSVTKIGWHAFYGCSSLTSITIPDSVTSIESWAFEDCSSLTSITIPNSVTSIGEGVFYDCSSLTSITIPNSITSIGVYAFRGCSSLTSITIPDSVTSIERYTFSGCSSLTSITIPNSVTSIGKGAFYDCSSLTSITIPNSVTEIGDEAFKGCSSLKSFNGKFASSDGRCLIKDGELIAFAPEGLTSYTIPNSTTSIGDYAFYGCDSLTSITCLATTPPAIGDLKIGETTKIYVPKKAVKAYKKDLEWSRYKKQIKAIKSK